MSFPLNAVVVGLVLLSVSLHSEAHLQVGYYSQTCRLAEFIIKDVVKKGVKNDMGLAAGLVRMHFHDCFVRGCESSVLIDSTPSNKAEKDSPPNKAKARLEAMCPGVVSCADILAFAARDAIEVAGGKEYDVSAGRRDGRISRDTEAFTNLPPPTADLNQLTQMFAVKGFTQQEMVTLSGAHTIGRSHCTSFTNRLYSFSANASQDPSLDKSYAVQLKQKCPMGSNDTASVVPTDPSSPAILDVGYYKGVLAHRGLFTSDQALLSASNTANQVYRYSVSPHLWKKEFGEAMVKMGQIGVLTGNAGEIRANCGVIN